MTLDKKMPHRLRESSFRRYEDLLAKVISSFPTCVVVEPTKAFNLAPITFACRFRDALKSLRENGWDSYKINKASFLTVANEIVVRERPDGTVAIGDRETTKTVKAPTASFDDFVPSTLDSPIVVGPIENKHLLCLLAHKRLLRTPVEVEGINEDEAISLQDAYDIFLEATNRGTYLLR